VVGSGYDYLEDDVVVTNTQLCVSIGVPLLFNAGLIGLLTLYLKGKFDAIYKRYDDILTVNYSKSAAESRASDAAK
jgi:hypothetical protein